MATASSAQREPSMEEILASIRRIIEDSDTGRKQPGEADELRQDLEPAASPASDVEAFRSELHAETGTRKPVTLAEVQAQLASTEPVIARMETPVRFDLAPVKAPVTLAPNTPAATVAPTTLAEVSARIAAEAVPAAGADAPATARVAETTDSIMTDWRREIAAVGEQKIAPVARPEKVETWRMPDAEPEVEFFAEELTAEPAFEPTHSRSEPTLPRSELARQTSGDAPSARAAILSERAGRQVAAAFGELSDAFSSRSKKTFDEMAEEMLRPMLQDWLDNNLPTLVERLVREEIERVARGA
ncbi:MAG: PopZ family protein [Mesorhizobium sp.]